MSTSNSAGQLERVPSELHDYELRNKFFDATAEMVDQILALLNKFVENFQYARTTNLYSNYHDSCNLIQSLNRFKRDYLERG